MEFMHKFGLQPSLFLFQIINFLIMMFILKKFLFSPLKKIFNERKYKIEQSLQDIENAKIILENANKKKYDILQEAKDNSEILTATAKASIKAMKEQSIFDAKNCYEQIIDDAKQKAEAEFENMNKQLGKISVDISEKIISKVLSNLFTDDEKQILTSRALEKMHEKITN
ncbi:MAG: F0F1 ATP synthase subunit B [Endomicrobium sp.]|jgi:F-type H+-transporting ATPase subunit b|nr:F0F1 ATP synthase subunit B [Endomicrobium sp.]